MTELGHDSSEVGQAGSQTRRHSQRRAAPPHPYGAFLTGVTLPPLLYLRSPLPTTLIAPRAVFQQVLAYFVELKGKSEVFLMLISGSD